MRYFTVNALLGASLIALGLFQPGWGWLLVWLGGCFAVVAVAYAAGAPGVYGKRRDGRLSLWSWLLFLPLHLYALLLWHILRLGVNRHEINRIQGKSPRQTGAST